MFSLEVDFDEIENPAIASQKTIFSINESWSILINFSYFIENLICPSNNFYRQYYQLSFTISAAFFIYLNEREIVYLKQQGIHVSCKKLVQSVKTKKTLKSFNCYHVND